MDWGPVTGGWKHGCLFPCSFRDELPLPQAVFSFPVHSSPSFQGNHLHGNLRTPGSASELLSHPQDLTGKCLGRALAAAPGSWGPQDAAGEVRAGAELGREGGVCTPCPRSPHPRGLACALSSLSWCRRGCGWVQLDPGAVPMQMLCWGSGMLIGVWLCIHWKWSWLDHDQP